MNRKQEINVHDLTGGFTDSLSLWSRIMMVIVQKLFPKTVENLTEETIRVVLKLKEERGRDDEERT
mgnify:CR=1 FL=1